jgi:phasin
MSNVETKTPAEMIALSSQGVREFAEKGVAQSREAFEKLTASAKDASVSLEHSAGVLTKGLSEFNAKSFEALQTNAYLTLDYLTSLASLKSPTEFVALQSAHVEKQIKTLNDQAKDLSELAQKIAKESVEPLKGQIEKVMKTA